MKSIYTNNEDEEMIAELKERDVDFNLSEFVRKCLIEETSRIKRKRSREEIEIEKQEVILEQKKFYERLSELNDELIEVDKEGEEIMRAGLLAKEKEMGKIEERKQDFLKWHDQFGFIINKEDAELLSEEYAKSNVGLIKSFLILKGCKEEVKK